MIPQMLLMIAGPYLTKIPHERSIIRLEKPTLVLISLQRWLSTRLPYFEYSSSGVSFLCMTLLVYDVTQFVLILPL